MGPAVSVVVPVYRNARTLHELHARIVSALVEAWSFEIVFVNDACPDGSLAVLASRAEKKPLHLVLLFGALDDDSC